MSKVTSKLQVTIPKTLADRYGIRPGDEIEWEAAGAFIRVIPPGGGRSRLDSAERLRVFDAALTQLLDAGADRILIACVTAHAVLREIPEPRRSRVIPLLDLAIDEIAASSRPHLLLATNGTRRARIFETYPRWSEVAHLVRWTDDADQHRLHQTVYRFKHAEPDEESLDWLATLPEKYRVDGLIFGCTELHLLHRLLAKCEAAGRELPRVVDPLWIAARDLAKHMR